MLDTQRTASGQRPEQTIQGRYRLIRPRHFGPQHLKTQEHRLLRKLPRPNESHIQVPNHRILTLRHSHHPLQKLKNKAELIAQSKPLGPSRKSPPPHQRTPHQRNNRPLQTTPPNSLKHRARDVGHQHPITQENEAHFLLKLEHTLQELALGPLIGRTTNQLLIFSIRKI